MYSLFVKLLATLLAALFSMLGISSDLPGFSDDAVSETQIEYLNEDKGSADALISITTTTDGEYKL